MADMTIITAIAALLISLIAVAITHRQTILLRRTIEAQTYTIILERAREINLSSTIDFINSLNFTDYETFQKNVSQEGQTHIRDVVDFFNDISHMIRNEYLDDYYPIRNYRPTLLTCSQKLLPWWLDGIRNFRGLPSIYNNFQWICEYTTYLEEEKKKRNLTYIPKLGYRYFLKKRGVTYSRIHS